MTKICNYLNVACFMTENLDSNVCIIWHPNYLSIEYMNKWQIFQYQLFKTNETHEKHDKKYNLNSRCRSQ